MDDAVFIHRLQFAFTVAYHYLFPQLTMGLALLILVLKTLAVLKEVEAYNQAARFWASRTPIPHGSSARSSKACD